MSKTNEHAQGLAGSGAGLSPVAEVKTALAGFISDFKSFHDDITQRVQQQEERLTMLDRKSQMRLAARPALETRAEAEAPHQKAFEAYVRTGDDDALRGLELEGKALNTAVAGDGGYLVDPVTAESIASVLASTASLRAIANVVHVEATSYDVLVDHGDVGSGWATETSTVNETAAPSIERITIPLRACSTTRPSTSRPGSRAASPTSSPALKPGPSSTATASTSPPAS